MDQDLTLEDLAHHSGLSIRTLRFYIQEGILPGPDSHGKNARYSQEHLDRLEAIRRLKHLHLPLQEIRQLLNHLTTDEIASIKQGHATLPQEEGSTRSKRIPDPSSSEKYSSALEYIQNLERGRNSILEISAPFASFSPVPEQDLFFQMVDPGKFSPESEPLPETWTRIILLEGIELNIKGPRTIQEQEKITKLVQFGRDLFRDPQKKEK